MKPAIKSFTLFLVSVLFFTTISSAQSNTCSGATVIFPDSTCVNNTSSFTGTLSGATADGGAIASSCTAINSEDVWYKFVARTQFPTITVSGLGSSWGTRLKIQLLSGACGGFTEVACANHAGTSTSLTPTLTNPLVPGTTYYIRIYKNAIALPTGANWGFTICVTDALSKGSRMGEVFSRTILSDANVLNYPWEVTYGPDNNLWITESKGYKVYKMDPNTGVKTTVLDISQGSTFLPLADRTFNCQFANGSGAQGGLAGLALHPKFLTYPSPQNYVYVSYIFSNDGGSSPTGLFYTNRLVRFYYDTLTGKMGSPRLIATLPGSSDHNSQRIIIAPIAVGGPKFLFYASGDMGAGQFGNRTRPNNAQTVSNLEGKILRYNLDTVGGIPWIPTTNHYSSTSPVWCMGIRNNQGFAYDSSLNILYGTSHGPYSDDELNIIDSFKNYGHPLVIGYADGNYNGNMNPSPITNTSISAGAPWPAPDNGISSCPSIGNEKARMDTINAHAATTGPYKGPLFSAYAASAATITNTWQTNPGNANWYSEAWSGLDLYQNKMIPGWYKSLVAAGLKWGRLIRLPLSASGTKTMPSNSDSANTADTITYFQSINRYRDLAFAPNGRDVFLVMDNSSATSGPGVGNPIVPGCQGCVIKYTYLGYDSAANGLSKIPKTIPVANGTVNTCNTATQVTIDGTNNFLWVPITGPDGNIVAEINAMGQNLGVVNTSFYKNSGAIRVKGGVHYLDRNITITPTITSFPKPVKVRLYISKAEFDALAADVASGVGSIIQLKVIKNNDPCGPSIVSTTSTQLTPTNTALPDLTHGTNGYVLQVNVSGFSSFYFAGSNSTLPLQLLTFTGTLKNSSNTELKWKTTNEVNTSHFFVERSVDAQYFDQIGRVAANGNSAAESDYTYNDLDVAKLESKNVFYRLKMYDNDGTYKYSNVIKVTMPDIQADLSISPNPVGADVNASITTGEACNADWQIIDNGGRILLKNATSLKKGNNKLNINISQLPSGSYYLKIKGDCIDIKTQFQKL